MVYRLPLEVLFSQPNQVRTGRVASFEVAMTRPLLPERPVLVAADAFGGDLRASVVAAAIGRGLERAGLMPPDLCPVGATIDALLPALGGETADGFALLDGGGTALVEAGGSVAAAVASGVQVVLLAPGAEAPPGLDLRGATLAVLDNASTLDELDFDRRMRAARAVITGEARLDPETLAGRIVGEIGTRTRQAGVPLHAIVGEDALDAFGKRIIDLQRVLVAGTVAELEAAGEQLGSELRDGLA